MLLQQRLDEEYVRLSEVTDATIPPIEVRLSMS